jgi:hypothetical protein
MFEAILFFVLLIIIIVLLYIVKILWELFATSVTVRLWKNNSGNFSSSRIMIWVGVMIAIFTLFAIIGKRR